MNLDESFKIAIDLHTKGKVVEAKNIYEKILKIEPNHLLALGNLGIVFSQLKQFNKAIEIFKKTIEINPKYAQGYNNLGNVLYELSDFNKSLDCYKKAVELDPNFSDAFNNIGNIYFKKQKLSEAIKNYESAISSNNGLNKDKPYYNLGNVYRESEEFKKSINFYKKAIEINPDSIDAYINISISLNKNNNYKEAIDYCQEAIKRDYKNIKALNNLGKYYHEIGNESLSLDCYVKALKFKSLNLKSRWLLMNTFPIIYKNIEEIKFYKKHFDENLKIIEDLLSKEINLNNEEILGALESCTNFYLHYQGEDITDLQKRYGLVVDKLSAHIYPDFHKKKYSSKSSNKIKIGYVSSFFYEHVISKLFKNWIIKLNKNKFDTYVYHIGKKNDHITDLLKKESYSFYNQTDIKKVINQINFDKLDILVFLDIGMEPNMQILGSLKLAPIQCCAYGVPVTTGLKNIDYFISGEEMETDNSHNHYSEKLIKLPALGIDYDLPNKIKIEVSSNTKNTDKVIFLNLQSNFKLLPQHDHIYFDIINKNPNCNFWFIGTKNTFIANKFKNRITKMCEEKKILVDSFFKFYPQMQYDNYLNLIRKSDIILDSLDWSGLNTSIDAIDLNKPVITVPSNLMRGRHTLGILKILKINELICKSKTEYVNLAVKLSKDLNFRDVIINKIKINKKLLFNNYKVIESLENFYKKSVN